MKNILILEDDKACNEDLYQYTNRLINSYQLEENDYIIHTAFSLEDALEVIFKVDILILDPYQYTEFNSIANNRNELFSIIKEHHPKCNLVMINPRKDSNTVMNNLERALRKLLEVKDSVKRMTFFI